MHLPLLVECNRNGLVSCNWCQVILKMNFNRWSCHGKKHLVQTRVKDWATIVFNEPIVHSIITFTCTGERKSCRAIWYWIPLGALTHLSIDLCCYTILPVESPVMLLGGDDGFLLGVVLVDRLNWPTMEKLWFTIPRATICHRKGTLWSRCGWHKLLGGIQSIHLLGNVLW